MSQKYSYKNPFYVIVVFVLERPTKLRSYWDGATALSDRLVPFSCKEYYLSCILPKKNGLWLVRRYKTKKR